MLRFLRLFAVLVLPLWILDGCLNKDPDSRIDERYSLVAPWSGATESVVARGNSSPQIHEVTDLKIGKAVITGKSGERYFIIDRTDNRQRFYTTPSERDSALSTEFKTTTSELHPLPWYSGIQGNAFYPYNLFYYAAVLLGIFSYCWKSRRKP